METLFDNTTYREGNYDAACRFVAELTDGRVTELLPGIPRSGSFCPIAATLAVAFDAPDWPDELNRETIEAIGGSPYLFSVDTNRVVWPITESIDLSGALPDEPEDVDAYLHSVDVDNHGNRWTWEYDDGGAEMLRRVVAVPDDMYAGGTVAGFIDAFDAGMWPSLEVQANREDLTK